ncbi:TRAP-type C4-dicarboxylate transport system, small permease component [Mariniphaga anaerophila]|uniref:TRAP-type C4-dicarboxylate transport system, small permease component n=1 Tax=Mariniphaga anaerophila TaxID=1484053 RepID=A0A1M4WI78_9BACT|nr:TRAP transporter small permease [Mariniphaga anaerophila]SHE80949.1 TRAP-type C4-dicarboxylate transport system, small permease component [Mariniphaga anaerophila]
MTIRKNIDKALEWVLVFLMSILVIDVLWQVISRYVMSSPSSFTDELAGFLLIWVGLLGATYVSGKREHLAIDLLLQRSTPQRRFKLELIISVVVILFAVTVLLAGGTWLVYTRFYLSVKSAALGLPLGLVYLVLPISGILIAYFDIDNIVRMVRENRKN